MKDRNHRAKHYCELTLLTTDPFSAKTGRILKFSWLHRTISFGSLKLKSRGGGTRYIPGWGGAARPLIP